MERKADWIRIQLPYPVEGTETQGYTVDYKAENGYRLLLGHDNSIVIVSWNRDYEDLLKELHKLLEMQKSGIQIWLDRNSRRISTNKT